MPPLTGKRLVSPRTHHKMLRRLSKGSAAFSVPQEPVRTKAAGEDGTPRKPDDKFKNVMAMPYEDSKSKNRSKTHSLQRSPNAAQQRLQFQQQQRLNRSPEKNQRRQGKRG
ncbi:unnamed protein product [Strongylus vulgaris]|uniref:Uncharacterized protein n=1 Tax=Strongylus vulgaris TaxID=40348 RepID=A0A3P7KFM9_STRVU|nr:unnamed protein product [Strongylus vulgaris]